MFKDMSQDMPLFNKPSEGVARTHYDISLCLSELDVSDRWSDNAFRKGFIETVELLKTELNNQAKSDNVDTRDLPDMPQLYDYSSKNEVLSNGEKILKLSQMLFETTIDGDYIESLDRPETYTVELRGIKDLEKDLDDMYAIEQKCFSPPMRKEQIEKVCGLKNYIVKVAEIDDEIVGFMIYKASKRTFIVLNMAVDPSFQGLGIGTKMFSDLPKRFTPLGFQKILVKNRPGSPGHEGFFLKQGCEPRGQGQYVYRK